MTMCKSLNEKEVAKEIGVCVTTVRRWRWSGKGPKFTKDPISRRVTYDKKDVEAFKKSYQPAR